MTQRTCRGQHHHSHVDHDHSPRCDVKFSSHHDAANDQNPEAWLFCGYDQQHQVHANCKLLLHNYIVIEIFYYDGENDRWMRTVVSCVKE
jgi:hypothetical protein